jgi:hypothetical protein
MIHRLRVIPFDQDALPNRGRSCGWKLPCRSPYSCRRRSHCASLTSVLRPGTCLASRALTSTTSNPRCGDPVHAGGFHGDRSYPARLEPVGQTVQVAREGAAGADRFWIASLSDCCHVRGGADVDCGGIGMYRGYVASGFDRFDLTMGKPPSAHRRRGWVVQSRQFPNRNHRAGVTTFKFASNPWATFFNGVLRHQKTPGCSLPG